VIIVRNYTAIILLPDIRPMEHSDYYVCLPVCQHASLRKFSMHVACGRGSVFLCLLCNTLSISSFVDDVVFFYNGLCAV